MNKAALQLWKVTWIARGAAGCEGAGGEVSSRQRETTGFSD